MLLLQTAPPDACHQQQRKETGDAKKQKRMYRSLMDAVTGISSFFPAWLKRLNTTNGLVSLSTRWCQNVGCSTSTEFSPNNPSLVGTSSRARPRAWR